MSPLFLGGLVLSLIAIVASTVMDGNSFTPLVGPSSLVLVFFGTLGASVMAYGLKDLGALPKGLLFAIKGSAPDPDEAVTSLAELAEIARRDGMLALEGRLEELSDPFLRQGLRLVVDGLDAAQVREVMEIELTALDTRHGTVIGFFKSLGSYAPTFGMIGTVVGLINMLGNLADPQQLGAGMSVALLTTLYGVLFANLLFLPVAGRLQRLHDLEIAAREVALDGILAIQSGASPRLLVERLETFLPPAQRVGLKTRSGEKPMEKAA